MNHSPINSVKLRIIMEAFNNTIDISCFPKEWDVELVILTPVDYKDKINSLPKDCVIFNMCDGVDEQGYLGENVLVALESAKLPYIGSTRKCYACKKTDVKIPGIPTPKYVLIKNRIYSDASFDALTFPVIIKPEYDSGSSGITELSKCLTKQELLDRLAVYKYQNIVVEEFIEGREVTVLAVEDLDTNEPIVLEPIESVFLNGYTFKSHEVKNGYDTYFDYQHVKDDILRNKIMTTVKNTFKLMNMDGYVRFDVRIDKNDNLYVVDANPYPGILEKPENMGGADLILEWSKIMNRTQFFHHSLKSALIRANRST